MPLKVVLFYNQGAEGFTETYYSNSSTQPADWLNAIPVNNWYPFVKFRAPITQLYAVRATLIGVKRTSSTYLFTGSNTLIGAGFAGSFGALPDVASTDMLVRLYDNTNKTRTMSIRGIVDADVVRNGNGLDQPGANLIAGVQTMVQMMQTLGLCIQAELRPPNTTYPTLKVIQVEPNPGASGFGTLCQTVLPTTQDFTRYPQVVFSGIPYDDLPGFPRIATVYSVLSTGAQVGIVIPYRLRMFGSPPYVPTKLFFDPVQNQYYPITQWSFVHFAERKTGRAFGVPRGRARSKVRAL